MYRFWYFRPGFHFTPTNLFSWGTVKESLELFPLSPGEFIIYEG